MFAANSSASKAARTRMLLSTSLPQLALPEANMLSADVWDENGAPPCFSDLEDDSLVGSTGSFSGGSHPAVAKLVKSRQAFAASLPAVERLERLATASSMRELIAQVGIYSAHATERPFDP